MPADIRWPDIGNTRWTSHFTKHLFPWSIGSGGPSTDPTSMAGSLAVGAASYAIPSSNVLYVAPGAVNGDGSFGSPFNTLAAAYSAASTNGTTIVMRAGTYNEGGDTQTINGRSGSSLGIFNTTKVGLTIQNYSSVALGVSEAVWIDGSVPFASSAWNFDSASGLWWAQYTMRLDRSRTWKPGAADTNDGSAQSGGTYTDDALNPCAANPDVILFDGTQMSQVPAKASVTAGKYWVEGNSLTLTQVSGQTNPYWFQASKVWIADNPTGHQVRYANKTSFMQIDANNCVIRGIGIRNYATYSTGFGALYVTGDGCTIENCQFTEFATTAVWGQGAVNLTLKNITMRNIGFAACEISGGCDNLLFDMVDFQYINSRNFNPLGPSLAISKIQDSQGSVLRNSIYSNSNCTGFWVDHTNANPWVYNCRLQNLGRQAIDMEGASGWIVANCLIQNIGQYGIWNNDADTGQAWNNTFVDCNRTYLNGGTFTIGQSNRRAWMNTPPNSSTDFSWMLDPRLKGTSYFDQTAHPDHQFQTNSFYFNNNVVVYTNSNGKEQGYFSCQSHDDTSTASITGSTGTTRDFQAFGPHMDGNVYYRPTAPQYPWIATAGAGKNPYIFFNPSQAYSTGNSAANPAQGIEQNSTLATSNPINNNYQLTLSAAHAKAVALPSDIAALIGKTAGTKRAGSFLVGG